MSVLTMPCRAEPVIYLDSFVEDDRFYVSLTGLRPCDPDHPSWMIALIGTKDGHLEQIACYEYVGTKIKVYLFREDLEFDAADEKFEFRESQCPECKQTQPAEVDPVLLPGT
jgi:hypothetical protein